MKSIIVPVDFSACSDNALELAVNLAREWGGILQLVHVYPSSIHNAEASLLPQNRTSVSSRTRLELMAKKVREKADGAFHVEAHFIRDFVPEGIAFAVKRYQGDIVVMGTHEPDGLEQKWKGTHTSRILDVVNVPVIAVPPDAKTSIPEYLLLAMDDHTDTEGEPFEVMREWKAKLGYGLGAFTIKKTAFNTQASQPEPIALGDDLLDYRDEVDHTNTIQGILHEAAWSDADWLVLIHKKRNPIGKLFHTGVTEHVVASTAIPVLIFRK